MVGKTRCASEMTMKKDMEKYEHWRAITESDYVTMFIKTWFTYISVLRNVFPNIDVFTEDGKPRGDKPFLNAFKKNILPFIKERIAVESFNNILFEFYPRSMRKVFSVFSQYFFQTFYRYNVNFHFEEVENTDISYFKVDIKNETRDKLKFCLIVYEKYRSISYREKIKFEIDLKEIVEKINAIYEENGAIDESGYLKSLNEKTFESIRGKILDSIEKIFYTKKYNDTIKQRFIKKINYTLASLNLNIENNYKYFHDNYKIYDENEYCIFKQLPFQNFYNTYLNGVYVQNRGVYDAFLINNGLDWFSDFVYQLRNALFHEIIDPLDAEWQFIFKSAYLILKQITDLSIMYLQENEEASN